MKNLKTARIFTRAHAMTRAAVAGTDYDYSATFGAALRICWREADDSAPAQWARMSGDQQLEALARMTRYAYERDQAGTDAEGKPRAPRMQWIRDADDFRAVAHEAWIRMAAYVEREDAEELPLAVILFRAVRTAAQYIDRQERRNARALKLDAYTAEDGSEATREYIIAHAAPLADPMPQPETRAIMRDEINAAAVDDIDRAILAAKAAGYSNREIAERIGKSHTAINKRLAAMRERYAARNDADQYAPDVVAYRIRRRLA